MIASGMYAPVLETIKTALGDAKHLLDVGCGEGSFLAQLVNEKTQAAVGFDIAKDGVYLATNQNVPAFGVWRI